MGIELARLPYDAAMGAEIVQIGSTSCNEGAGGITGRTSHRSQTLREFHFTVGPDYAVEVLAIHDTHTSMYPFGIRDWRPGRYTITDEEQTDVDIGDDVTTVSLSRLIRPANGLLTRTERILIPDEEEVEAIIKINDVALEREDWDFSDDDLIFGKAEIPNELYPSGATCKASLNFLVAGCFVNDEQSTTVLAPNVASLPDVVVREIFEEELIELVTSLLAVVA